MKLISTYLALAVLINGYCTPLSSSAQSAQSTNNASKLILTSIPHEESYKLDQPILVDIQLKNLSTSNVLWESYRPYPGYTSFKFSLSMNGKAVETTAFHREITGQQRPDDPMDILNGSFVPLTLAPAEEIRFVVDLKKLYKIEGPGIYTLVVSKEADQYDSRAIVSKPLKILVEP